MALRILFLIISFTLIVNIVLLGTGLITGVNLYQKYGKQILNFFTFLGLSVIFIFVIISIVALK